MTESPRIRLAAFGALLVAVFAVAWIIGAQVGPAPARTPAHTSAPAMHMAMP